MAKAKKEKSQTEPSSTKSGKKPGGGAVIGSVLLFILTCILGILFLCSMTLHTALTQGSPSAALSKMDLSQAEITEDGKTQKLGTWIYDWYLWDAPNLSQEYAETVTAQPEVNEFFCDYLDELGDYLIKGSDTLPELDVNDIADLMQVDLATRMQKETGVTFAEADRQSIQWSMGDDIADWNEMLRETVGSGFGKFFVRFSCTMPGVITFGILAVVSFILWLFLAIRGHWRKGRFLTGYGCAVAIPSLLVLAASGVLLLLVNVFDVIPALSFAADGLPTLLLPAVWSSLTIALCGMIVASIGICTNAVVKAKRKKAEIAEMQPAAPAAAAEPAPAPEFVYTEAPETKAEAPAAEPTAQFCPHCGAQNEPGSRFCGSCGQEM
ncbi:MAG: zinc ribbon domain-containing protein [Ruminococcus sp.]